MRIISTERVSAVDRITSLSNLREIPKTASPASCLSSSLSQLQEMRISVCIFVTEQDEECAMDSRSVFSGDGVKSLYTCIANHERKDIVRYCKE